MNLILIRSAYSFFKLGAIPLFRLDDQNRRYLIKKSDAGYYFIETVKDGKTERAFIGSTQVPLDKFEDKTVQIMGEFRPTLGFPTCYKKCPGNYRAPVIDIKDLIIVNDAFIELEIQ